MPTAHNNAPKGAFAKTVLMHCDLGAHIRPEGFHDWGKTAAHDTVFYAEYACTGAGAQGARAPFAKQLTDAQAAAITLDDFWANALEHP